MTVSNFSVSIILNDLNTVTTTFILNWNKMENKVSLWIWKSISLFLKQNRRQVLQLFSSWGFKYIPKIQHSTWTKNWICFYASVFLNGSKIFFFHKSWGFVEAHRTQMNGAWEKQGKIWEWKIVTWKAQEVTTMFQNFLMMKNNARKKIDKLRNMSLCMKIQKVLFFIIDSHVCIHKWISINVYFRLFILHLWQQ